MIDRRHFIQIAHQLEHPSSFPCLAISHLRPQSNDLDRFPASAFTYRIFIFHTSRSREDSLESTSTKTINAVLTFHQKNHPSYRQMDPTTAKTLNNEQHRKVCVTLFLDRIYQTNQKHHIAELQRWQESMAFGSPLWRLGLRCRLRYHGYSPA